jgi:peptide/nickel transport system substrate-binding protein
MAFDGLFLRVPRAASAVALALALWACDGDQQRTDSKSDRTAAIAVMSLPRSLGNPFTAISTPELTVWTAIFDGLTRVAPDQTLAPGLAISWVQEAPTSWTFTLRPQVTFSNGTPFTSAAVVAALEWVRSSEGRSTAVGQQLGNVSSWTAPDDYTVRIAMDRPDPLLPARVAWLPIVEPTAWRQLGPEKFAISPIGTGPYAVKQWGPGHASVILSRVDASWRSGNIQTLEFISIPDAISRAQALVAGSVDIAEVVEDEIGLLKSRGSNVVVAPGLLVIHPAFVLSEGRDRPFRDVRVRQAMNYAINKEAIIAKVYAGFGRVASQPAPAGLPSHNQQVLPYPYDPDKARALLRAAGFEQGFPFSIALNVDSSPSIRATYELVTKDLQAVGISATIAQMPNAKWVRQFSSADWGDSDMFSMISLAQLTDIGRSVEHFLCDRPNPFFCDEALDQAYVQVQLQKDINSRNDAMRQFMRTFHERAPVLFLIDVDQILGSSGRLEGTAIVNRVPVYEELRWR